MSRLALGTRMVRLDDGMAGVVGQHEGELRILYTDRGEQFVAAKSQKWQERDPAALPLREEERLMIALTADRMLGAFMKHEPHRYWEALDLDAVPFDAGFVKVVVEYLGRK